METYVEVDPLVTVQYALAVHDGNQAALARCLGVQRASVNQWVTGGRQYLPALQAHRFVKIFGHPSDEDAA